MSSFRATIPNNVRKTIQNIKEIAGNHTDDEIYAMLKECSMDPNETAQKLLFQDTFHEVKRKRYRRKEILNTKESAESRGRSGMPVRGARGGGRGNYSSRYNSHGRNANTGRENGVNQNNDGGSMSAMPILQKMDNKTAISAVTTMQNGPTNVVGKISTHEHVSHDADFSTVEESSGAKTGSAKPSCSDSKSSNESFIGGEHMEHTLGPPNSDQLSSSMVVASVSEVYSSALDTILVPSLDAGMPGVAGAIKCEVKNQGAFTSVEASDAMTGVSKPGLHEFANHLPTNKFLSSEVVDNEITSFNDKTDLEIESMFMHGGKIPNKYQGAETNSPSEASQARPLSLHVGTPGGRPSSNYSNRSQPIGLQKVVGPSMEWKPKPSNTNIPQHSPTVNKSDAEQILIENSNQSLTSSDSSVSEEATLQLQKRLEELHFSEGGNVIIPNHLQVPEAERTGLSFGSFGANFAMNTHISNGLDSGNIVTPSSVSSPEMEESTEPSSSVQNVSPPDHEGEDPEHSQSSTNTQENASPADADVPSSISPGLEYDHSKAETVFPPVGSQYSVVHTSTNYSAFGPMPAMLGSQIASADNSDTQPRDTSRVPSFIVQQPFDPSSYYTQFYRPTADNDGRFSPFLTPGSAKYNGSIAVLPSQSGQSAQENGNPMVLSTAGPTPLVTQAASVMQSSIAATQQPVSVFRQPAGVHISPYPPNYIPYNQYFPPFYVPPPTIHHFLSNAAFPQQPTTGSIYQAPAASAVKYSLSQYKPVTNAGNSAHIGIPTGYGSYTSAPTGYSPSPAVSTGNSTANEEPSASQYKESNVFIAGQQSEGSTVWIPAGREMTALQASSFYNLPPQGQHITFPTQPGHGTFTGIYHPTQTMAAATVHPLLQQSQTMAGPVEIVGPPNGAYQQPQRPQINWASNY